MVAAELDRDPDISVDALFEKARGMDSAIGDLSLRQFHARYPLPIKRSRSRAKEGGRKQRKRRTAPKESAKSPTSRSRRAAAATPRDEVRRIFLDFAGELARAESRASIVEVLSRVDDYVDRSIRAATMAKNRTG